MNRIRRREFMALAGLGPLGAAFGHRSTAPASKGSSRDLIGPWLEIDTGNLAWNVSQVRKRVGDRPIMAVIKCNAYGHGLVEMARTFARLGVRHFAVVKVEEALALRRSGVEGMVLNFGPFSRPEAEDIVRHGVSQSVFSDAVEVLAEATDRLNLRANVHIKVDTGLGRVGVPHETALPFIGRVASMPGLLIEGIFTTLTEEEDFDPIQVKRLLGICEQAAAKGLRLGLRHAASSAAVAKYPPAFLDMVRPGDCLYGLEPLPNLDLKPVMSLKTRIILIKAVRSGDTLGYHRVYKADRPMRVATLPLGYADGYPPQAANRAQVLIRGRRRPLIASVTANHSLVDVTDVEGVEIGDEVVLFGSQGDAAISLSELAAWGQSSVYRIAIGMNPGLPRIYL